MAQILETSDETHPPSGLRSPDGARILIVCDDDSITAQLKTVLRESRIISETARGITAGCELAKSGQFQVVISQPLLSDGSWGRLIDIAKHYDLGFEVILLARTFDLMQWTEALQEGAFDVLESLYGLPKAAETVKRAVWAAYLKGAGPPGLGGKESRTTRQNCRRQSRSSSRSGI
jgi:DNA-binding NtrC family response regulator